MAKLKDLKVTIGLSKAGLTKLNSDLRRTKANFRRNFGEISDLANRVGTAIIGGVVAGLTAVIKAGADMQRVEVGFRSIMGSAEGASQMVDKLNQFTASTPYRLEEVARSARQLIAVGTGVDDVNDRLRMLGDIAAASGNSISDIAAAFAKVQAKGKVELENLNQLAERGIPIFDELRKVTGDANMEFGAGSVTVDQYNQALANMAAEGGFANDAMVNLSETVSGRFSTAMDNFMLALGDFAEKSGLLAAVSDTLDDTTRMLQRFATNNDDANSSMARSADLLQRVQAAHKGNAEALSIEADEAVTAARALDKVLGTEESALALAKATEVANAAWNQYMDSLTAGTTMADAPVAAPVETVTKEVKAKKELIDVERSHLQQLGQVATLQINTAVNTLAAVNANHQLKISYDNLGQSLEPVIGRFRQLGMFVKDQLPAFFEGAFQALSQGTKSFGEFMLQTLERLLIKATALVATFAVLSVLMGGATGVAELTGGKAGLKFFMGAGMGIPQMADGGLFSGASLAMVGEGPGTSAINPEVVAPLDKLQQMMGGGNVTVTGRLDGRDILISSERAGFDRNRVRGF